MSLLSSNFTLSVTQANGLKYYLATHVDSLGNVQYSQYIAQSADNDNTIVLECMPLINAQMKEYTHGDCK